jgi:hypothetical protein
MKKLCMSISTMLALAACDVTEPVVSDFNGNSVKIATSSFDSVEHQRKTALVEANRICGKVGKKAEYASTSANAQTYQNTNLYLCL